jgi:hypothetical protein
MANSDRPSPFTIPEPAFKFAEGPPAEPRPSRSMTVAGLIQNLTMFADFYEGASADIAREVGIAKPRYIGTRDAHADAMQRDFRATVAIDRVRAYVLAKYGADLTIATARRLLGDLIQTCGLSVDAAEALPLEVAMDKLAHPPTATLESVPPCPGCGSAPAATDVDDICPCCGAYTFLCGIIEHVPLGDTPVIKQQVTKQRWKRIPPSQVRANQPGDGLPAYRPDLEKETCLDALVGQVLYWRNGVLPFYWCGAYHPGDFQRRIANPLRQCLVWLDARGFDHLSARLQSGFDAALRCVAELDAKYAEHPAPEDATESDSIVGDRLLPCYDKTSEFVALVEDIKKATAANESLIERLLAGPDDVELSPRDLALLEAHLRQPVSLATIPQEKEATGHSPTEAARNKLTLIRDFNRGLKGQGDAQPEQRSDPAPAVVQAEPLPAGTPESNALLALMRVYANGIADDRIKKAIPLLADDRLTVNEKLTKIDALMPFPATASAEQLGEMLGVTKQAVLKTEWWKQHRQGEKESEVGRRRDRHRKRAETYEAPG